MVNSSFYYSEHLPKWENITQATQTEIYTPKRKEKIHIPQHLKLKIRPDRRKEELSQSFKTGKANQTLQTPQGTDFNKAPPLLLLTQKH